MEEISLSSLPSDFIEETVTENRNLTGSIVQSGMFKLNRLSLKLYNHRYLRLSSKQHMQPTRSHELDVGILDPAPRRMLKIDWCYLLAFILLAALTITSLFGANSQYAWILTGVTAITAAFALALTIYHSHDRMVFFSVHGRVPLVVLYNESDKSTFKEFVAQLSNDIATRKKDFEELEEFLSWELREHRKLMEAGAIAEKRYNIVKDRILGQHSILN